MITLYDIPSSLPGVLWSPNTLLTRFALEFKGIPFETKWVEYPDVEAANKKAGSPPTAKWPDGTPYFSVPFIEDTETKKVISDSWNIVIYLDETYPNTPRLVPKGSNGLMKAFIDIADEKLMNQAFIPYNMPKTYKILNPASQPHFSKARQWIAGKTFAEFEAIANWDTVKASMDWVEELIKLNEAEGFTGGYIIGDKFTYAEIFVGSKLYWWIVQGKDSQLWKDLVALNGGRWGRLIDHLEKLGKVDQIEWKP